MSSDGATKRNPKSSRESSEMFSPAFPMLKFCHDPSAAVPSATLRASGMTEKSGSKDTPLQRQRGARCIVPQQPTKTHRALTRANSNPAGLPDGRRGKLQAAATRGKRRCWAEAQRYKGKDAHGGDVTGDTGGCAQPHCIARRFERQF